MADEQKTKEKLAIILVRGMIGMQTDMKKTCSLLNIHKKNSCVIMENNPVHLGMANRIKDFATFGIINEETLKLLQEKRQNKIKKENSKSMLFHLNPPIGGFERKGIKKPFTVGGALGNRKDKINDLIKKMV
jgi:large subunit ribosomal protein L30